MAKQPESEVFRTISDVVVHYLLARKKTEPILVSFINAVLTNAKFPKIVRAKVENPFNVRTFPAEKESVLDILAEDEHSRKIAIEIQILEQDAFVERCLYYGAKVYSSQLIKREGYTALRPVISIVLTEFDLLPELDRLHTSFFLTAKESPGYILTEHLQFHFLQMPKTFDSARLRGVGKPLVRWLKFFGFPGRIDERELQSLAKQDEELAMAIHEYKKFQSDPKLRDLAARREKFLLDQRSAQLTAERRGREEGREEGEAWGIAIGEVRGKAEGSKEKSQEIARSLLREGLDVAFIARTTGLSVEEIEKLPE